MRRSIATISAAVLGLALITPAAAHAAPTTGKSLEKGPTQDTPLSPADKASLAAGIGVAPKAPYGTKPKGPNPLLAEVADASKVDFSGWANYMKVQAKARTASRLKANSLAAAAAST